MAKALAHFTIARTGDEYMIAIEDSDGETLELTADYDQLDLVSEEIGNVLDHDEEGALEVDEDEDEEIEEE